MIGLTIALAGCESKQPEAAYDSIAAAKNAGGMDRGWLPEYLPTSSYDIHEVHRVSSPTGWCSFRFNMAGAESFRDTLQASRKQAPTVFHIESPGTTWWPPMLEGEIDFKKVHDAAYDLYQVETPERSAMNRTFVYLFAVDWVKGQAFFYQTTRSN
jgi:hypothetical protein